MAEEEEECMLEVSRSTTRLFDHTAALLIPWMPEVFLSLSDGMLRSGEWKPLVQAYENLTSMPRLIDIEKTSNLMRDITYQSASVVPTGHSSYLL